MSDAPPLPEIAALASGKLGRPLRIAEALRGPDFKNDVADATCAYVMRGDAPGDAFVVVLSNPAFPDSVARAAQKAAGAAAALPADLSRRVLTPVLADRVGTRSFAAYPMLTPVSKRRLIEKLQKMHLEGPVSGWLTAVGLASRSKVADQAVFDARFAAPLDYLVQEESLPDFVRREAALLRDTLSDRDGRFFTVLQHGDFWLGNILLRRARIASADFAVIDWGGSDLQGHGFIDLMRYLDSTSRDPRRMMRHMRRYCAALGVPAESLRLHVLCSLGALGLRRNKFPMPRFAANAARFTTMASSLGEALARGD